MNVLGHVDLEHDAVQPSICGSEVVSCGDLDGQAERCWGSDLFFRDRKLYDIAAVAARDQWPAVYELEAHMRQVIQNILLEGRESGEFERKTPLDEAANAIYLVMRPYVNPVQLQYNLEMAPVSAVQLSALILRSLSP